MKPTPESIAAEGDRIAAAMATLLEAVDSPVDAISVAALSAAVHIEEMVHLAVCRKSKACYTRMVTDAGDPPDDRFKKL